MILTLKSLAFIIGFKTDLLRVNGTATRRTGLSGSDYGRWAGFFGEKSDAGPVVLGGLDHSVADRVIKQHLAEIRYAYESALGSNPGLSGKVVIKITIARDGAVSEATVKSSEWNPAGTEAGKKVGEEICKIFRYMKFPASKGGGIQIISYPLNFEPAVTK